MQEKDVIGEIGEREGRAHLRRSGLRVVESNYRCPAGEIDIVAQERGVWVFCEVKTRTGRAFGGPESAVDPKRYRRMRRVAQWYMLQRGITGAVRIDLIGVTIFDSEAPSILHVRGI